LNLLRELTGAGYKISHVASLPTEKLRQLAAESVPGHGHGPGAGHGEDHDHAVVVVAAEAPASAQFLEQCLASIKALDAAALDEVLKRAAGALGELALLQRLVAPLIQTLGELWRAGEITSAHEHFATASIRVLLGNATKPFGVLSHAPALLVATPAGQIHELGALLVAATAVHFGWRVTYLGASLPAAEIAGAARLSQARAVALSLVYPEDDPHLEDELGRLREALPPYTALLVGGRAMSSYRAALEKIGAIGIESLAQFGSALDDLRKPRTKISREITH
jgi:methanogenic corrinoid protein MtbC1